MYEFTDEYLTGIEAIDNEHRELFRIAGEAYDLLKNQFITDKFDYIAHILQELRDYTKTHFAHEEAYMQSIGYKRLFTQKMEHDAFVKKLDSLDLDDIDEKQHESLLDVLDFLANWLINHIKGKDMLIGK